MEKIINLLSSELCLQCSPTLWLFFGRKFLEKNRSAVGNRKFFNISFDKKKQGLYVVHQIKFE
jgi:hypothetical protein